MLIHVYSSFPMMATQVSKHTMKILIKVLKLAHKTINKESHSREPAWNVIDKSGGSLIRFLREPNDAISFSSGYSQ